MSRTLFWYVFKDLLRIFFMASGAIAAIMSFGGLLRPLTQNGLGSAQVLQLLGYFMPAMSTYSLPVAALFATTVVYGRMAADNEQTACRASGISFLAMAAPAVLLGLLVSVGSMYMLCFTVPDCTAKIEQTIKSNLARYIAHEIDQTHEAKFGKDDKVTVYAQSAELSPPDPQHPNRQAVVLHGPLIVSAYTPPDRPNWFHVAKEFWTARTAVAYVQENPDDGSAMLTATLNDGIVFPRRFTDPKARQGGMGTAQFGPIQLPPRMGQKTKFMNIFQLKQLEKDPTRGQEVKQVTADFIKEDQANAFCKSLADDLAAGGQCVLQTGNDTYTLTSRGAAVNVRDNTITLTAAAGGKSPRFRQSSSGQTRLNAEARTIRLTADADTPNDQFYISIDLKNALVDAGDMPSPQADFSRRLVLAMSPAIAAMKTRTAGQYLNSAVRPEKDRQHLLFAWVDLVNHIRSEMHARAAFVVSCLLLVLVGAALGMMFKSGNFLTAFAVSVIPALFSTVLIVTGQHTAESTPNIVTLLNNPLAAGVTLIWTGNVVIGLAAVALLWRLQRQ
jgi:lipopolysaccharide export LptBFGC system permease protein LptF